MDPPLPIPNREVKHTNADGTAPPGGRVGSCRFSEVPIEVTFSRDFFFCARVNGIVGANAAADLLFVSIFCI